uniref:Cadherin domain-containing protein n=1 Tax=Sinocyclocheilus grahami TaxID=75366 RepID=A0A672SCN8_SINGR
MPYVNDHFPSFPEKDLQIKIAENTLKGTRFGLPTARDLDFGVNSVRFYRLGQNDNFEIEEKIPFLVLKKPLDREHKSEHLLILKALDGGNPPKSGTLNITVTVLDSNDNRPVFSQDTYSVSLQENSPIGTTVIKINASDSDEGPNSEIEYALGKTLKRKVYDIFQLDRITGEIKVKGAIDFEDTDVYKLDVQASDKGQPPLSAQGRVIINIQDINDNMPEIELTSLSNIVAEDCKPGTVIALISVSDKDSGVNGKVVCSLSKNVPFELKHSFQDNMYSLVTKGRLDRELVPHYDITITATDLGQPPLSSITTLSIQVADVNDNQPEFSSNFLELYIFENNAPGASIFSVRASDKDVNENALISYQINRGGVTQNDMTSFLNINSETGVIYSLKTFDFEAVKTFQFQVVATDSGTPSLSSNVTVNVFILDQNDNVPVILYPVSANGSAEAYDADIGYNGWLLFSLQEVSDHSLFSLDRQIRTLRSFTETDEAQHKLLILVKDNGNVSLSATETILRQKFSALCGTEPAQAVFSNGTLLVSVFLRFRFYLLFRLRIYITKAHEYNKHSQRRRKGKKGSTNKISSNRAVCYSVLLLCILHNGCIVVLLS